MDTRDTPEQAELRRSARQLARELGPGDGRRPRRRDARASGSPPRCTTRAGSSCATTRAPAYRSRAASKPPSSPTRSAARSPTSRSRGRCSPRTSRAGPGIRDAGRAVVVLAPRLVDAAVVADGGHDARRSTPSTCGDELDSAYVLGARRRRLPPRGSCRRRQPGAAAGTDLTRTVRAIPAGNPGARDRRTAATAHRRRPRGVDRARARRSPAPISSA